jgi:hypothetical protein
VEALMARQETDDDDPFGIGEWDVADSIIMTLTGILLVVLVVGWSACAALACRVLNW